jgi:hypothetical protein
MKARFQRHEAQPIKNLISNDLQPANNLQKNSSFRGWPSGQNPESRGFIGSHLDSGFRRGGPGMTG